MIKDVQNSIDKRNIPLQKVGVKNVETLLNIERKGSKTSQKVYAKAKMSVYLPSNYKGTHMSRFIEILEDYRKKNLIGVDIKKMLEDMKIRLESKSAYLKFDFKYFVKKKAPKSALEALMCYDCYFEGTLDESDNYKFYLGIKIPLTTLCPCSKEISDCGAHNQRAIVSLKVSYDEDKHIWLEDLIEEIESCGSSQLYSLLKREDEKSVTEQAYNNPKFVEDVIRDVVIKLENHPVISNYEVEIEAFESIHNHSAWARQVSDINFCNN